MARLTRCVLLLTIVLLPGARLDAQFFGFDAPEELSQFSVDGSLEEVTTGIGGSGALRAAEPSLFAWLAHNQRSYLLADVGDSLSLSLMFRYEPPSQITSNESVAVDLATLLVLANPRPDDRSQPFLIASVGLSQSAGQPIQTYAQVASSRLGSGSGQAFLVPSLVADHWYKLSGKFSIVDSPTAPNFFQISLDDFGADGSSQLSNLLNTGVSRPFFAEFRDTSAWAGFGINRLSPDGTGVAAADNFEVVGIVPEPGLPAVLMSLLLASAWTQRLVPCRTRQRRLPRRR